MAKKNNAEIYLIIFPWPENLIYGQEKFEWRILIRNYESNNCSELLNFFEDFRKIMDENDGWQNLIYIKMIFILQNASNLISVKF